MSKNIVSSDVTRKDPISSPVSSLSVNLGELSTSRSRSSMFIKIRSTPYSGNTPFSTVATTTTCHKQLLSNDDYNIKIVDESSSSDQSTSSETSFIKQRLSFGCGQTTTAKKLKTYPLSHYGFRPISPLLFSDSPFYDRRVKKPSSTTTTLSAANLSVFPHATHGAPSGGQAHDQRHPSDVNDGLCRGLGSSKMEAEDEEEDESSQDSGLGLEPVGLGQQPIRCQNDGHATYWSAMKNVGLCGGHGSTKLKLFKAPTVIPSAGNDKVDERVPLRDNSNHRVITQINVSHQSGQAVTDQKFESVIPVVTENQSDEGFLELIDDDLDLEVSLTFSTNPGLQFSHFEKSTNDISGHGQEAEVVGGGSRWSVGGERGGGGEGLRRRKRKCSRNVDGCHIDGPPPSQQRQQQHEQQTQVHQLDQQQLQKQQQQCEQQPCGQPAPNSQQPRPPSSTRRNLFDNDSDTWLKQSSGMQRVCSFTADTGCIAAEVDSRQGATSARLNRPSSFDSSMVTAGTRRSSAPNVVENTPPSSVETNSVRVLNSRKERPECVVGRAIGAELRVEERMYTVSGGGEGAGMVEDGEILASVGNKKKLSKVEDSGRGQSGCERKSGVLTPRRSSVDGYGTLGSGGKSVLGGGEYASGHRVRISGGLEGCLGSEERVVSGSGRLVLSARRLIRCQSESVVKSVLSISGDRSDLIGDFSREFSLPIVCSRHQDLKAISVSTIADILRNGSAYNPTSSELPTTYHSSDDTAGGLYPSCSSTEYVIVDCRYPYEFEAGHIMGAKNIFTKDDIISHFFKSRLSATDREQQQQQQQQLHQQQPQLREFDRITEMEGKKKSTVLIFHCEFSSERGPKLMRFLRNTDRALHKDCYPALSYPEIYLLEGGYKAFYESYSQLCQPTGYKPMTHQEHLSDLRICRAKSKLWAGLSAASNAPSAYDVLG